MSSFDERLWAELASNHGEPLAAAPARTRPAHPRRGGRILLAAGAALTLAGGTTATLALTAGTTTPAFAVTVNRDGSVTLTLNQLLGAKAANAKLASLGVNVRVVARERGCMATATTPPTGPRGLRTEHRLIESILSGNDAPVQSGPRPGVDTGLEFRIRPDEIPAADTLLITARRVEAEGAHGSHAVGMSVALYRDPAPTCVPLG
ncbi:MAG TPA: hypothetical protein VHT27_01120 [Solirubrobacteraceae bacterium]|jgi:hypothetical protein|nr:hypothetical protein [Solirubrobacteraceae bacterium]